MVMYFLKINQKLLKIKVDIFLFRLFETNSHTVQWDYPERFEAELFHTCVRDRKKEPGVPE